MPKTVTIRTVTVAINTQTGGTFTLNDNETVSGLRVLDNGNVTVVLITEKK